jgi:PhzF family phenazine biosynthesis protein
MEIKTYQVDAFTNRLFEGNPAAICLLDAWLADDLLQSIAMENNLSETAFIVPRDQDFHIRWFTPTTEIDLCGHATLAAAFVLWECNKIKAEQLVFHSLSGPLTVFRNSNKTITLDFPVRNFTACEIPNLLIQALGVEPIECYQSVDYLVVLENEKQIRDLQPDFRLLTQLKTRGIIVTAKGDHDDFVSRFFAPKKGINEDPVTGSAHCTLTPFWTERLGKNKLRARQLSKRQGEISCELKGERVQLTGNAILFSEGFIHLF